MAAIDIASIGLTKTNLLSGGMTFIVFIIFILLASAGIGFVMWLSRYRMMIFVEERRGNSVIEYLTRGGIIVNNKSGVKELVVWRGKWNWNLPLRSEVPDNKYFRINSKGAKFLRIIKDSVDTFKVVPPTDRSTIQKLFRLNKPQKISTTVIVPIPTIEYADLPAPVDLDWYNWASQTLKGMSPRFRNDVGFLRENAGIVGLGMISFIFVVMIIVGFQKWEDGTANLKATAASNAQSVGYITNAQIAAGGVQVVTPTGGVSQQITPQGATG